MILNKLIAMKALVFILISQLSLVQLAKGDFVVSFNNKEEFMPPVARWLYRLTGLTKQQKETIADKLWKYLPKTEDEYRFNRQLEYIPWKEVFNQVGMTLDSANTETTPIVKDFSEKLGVIVFRDNEVLRKIIETAPYVVVEELQDIQVNILGETSKKRNNAVFWEADPELDWAYQSPATGAKYVKYTRPGIGYHQFASLDTLPTFDYIAPLEAPMAIIDPTCPPGNKVFRKFDETPDSHAGALMNMLIKHRRAAPGLCLKAAIHCIHLKTQEGAAKVGALLQAIDDALHIKENAIILHPFEFFASEAHYLEQAYKRIGLYKQHVIAAAGNKYCALDLPEDHEHYCLNAKAPITGYPTRFKLNPEIASAITTVTGIDKDFKPAPNAPRGAKLFDVFAPSVELNIRQGSRIIIASGTSYAATLVAGVAQYIKTVHVKIDGIRLQKYLYETAAPLFGTHPELNDMTKLNGLISIWQLTLRLNSMDAAEIYGYKDDHRQFDREFMIVFNDTHPTNVQHLWGAIAKYFKHDQIEKVREIIGRVQAREAREHQMWRLLVHNIASIMAVPGSLATNETPILGDYEKLKIIIVKETLNGRLQNFFKALKNAEIVPAGDKIQADLLMKDQRHEDMMKKKGRSTARKLDHEQVDVKDIWYLLHPGDKPTNDLDLPVLGYGAKKMLDFKLELEKHSKEIYQLPPLAPLVLIDPFCPRGPADKLYGPENLAEIAAGENHANLLVSLMAAPWNTKNFIPGLCPKMEIQCVKLQVENTINEESFDVTLTQILDAFEKALHYDNSLVVVLPVHFLAKESLAMKSVFKAFLKHPKLLIAAAGNSPCDMDVPLGDKKSCFQADGKVRIQAIGYPLILKDQEDIKNKYMTVGASWMYPLDDIELVTTAGMLGIDVFAPGMQIPTLTGNGELIDRSGSSFAAAGTGAITHCLYLDYYLTHSEEFKILMTSMVHRIDELKDKCVGGGVVNAFDTYMHLVENRIRPTDLKKFE